MVTPLTLEEITIDLKDRNLAALLAWLLPGAGHMYQGRWGKGWLFSVCLLGTFVFGMYLSGGTCVYAYWGQNTEQRRLYYFAQVGIGAPALPALVQANAAPHNRPLGEFMAPPDMRDKHLAEGVQYKDELAYWHARYGDGFEMGTIYTVIAGLLNLLVVFDAWAGPMILLPDKRKSDEPEPDPSPGGTPPGEPPKREGS